MVDVLHTPTFLSTSKSRYNVRFENVVKKFKEKFGCAPNFVSRAPGRVNIIGEHIDYCGYAVLPMAIQQDVLIAVHYGKDLDTIVICNTDRTYSDYECSVKGFNLDKTEPQWYNYVLSGIQGVIDYAAVKSPCGMMCLVDGVVPPSAGLSSSSAVVCSSTQAAAYANGLDISKETLTDIAADCENFIATSTEGGNMDQAIAFMAQEGTAKFIEFNPLHATDVQLPEGVTFVITHSCVEIHKGGTECFNVRVVECRLAAQVIAKQKGLNWKDIKTLCELQTSLGTTLEGALTVVKETLHPEPYSKQEVFEILEISEEELAKTSLIAFTYTVQLFKLFDRANHVFSEASRVYQFKHVCDHNPSGALDQLGALMNDSHTSCKDLFECSCNELNELVEICIQSGALGSRLTGAGWGGCVVSMVPSNEVKEFILKVKDTYYAKNSIRASRVNSAIFATHPGGGASIIKL